MKTLEELTEEAKAKVMREVDRYAMGSGGSLGNPFAEHLVELIDLRIARALRNYRTIGNP